MNRVSDARGVPKRGSFGDAGLIHGEPEGC